MLERYKHYRALELDSPAERVLRISFNKPDTLNSLDQDGHRELTYIWRDIDADEDVSVVILTGKGRAFSAGGDFGMIENMITDSKALMRSWKEARDLVYNIINCSKPIVSAINGVAVGAGLVAGLLADISIAGKSARIVDGHTRLGVAAGDSAVINWPLLCGMAKAKYHLLTCEPMNGEEAERIGMVSLCVPDEELQDKALSVATRLRDGAPAAIRWTKYALNNWYRMAGPAFDASTALEMLGFTTSEAAEGVRSHREKRKPNFDPGVPL
ncbi:MAG: enoyl-CoA hydratase/isomerase family protein [Gammaproteobacteria bacterium]|nr:enoyl-CoA hydratase/isomerase family protein [Gammaproteobacteria bacterium]